MATKTLPDGQVVMDPSDPTREYDILQQLETELGKLRSGTANAQTLATIVGGLARLYTGNFSVPPDAPPPPAPSAHTHPQSEITSLATALSGKSDTSHTHPELPTPGQKNALAGATGTPGTNNEYLTKQSIGSAGTPGKALAADDATTTNARTPSAHTHTKSQVTDFAHTHPTSEVTGLDTALTGKVATNDPRLSDARPPTSHTHTASEITDFNAAGDARWSLIGGGGFSWSTVARQANDVTQASAAFGNSGLSFPFVANGIYAIDLYLIMRSSLATAGFRLALDTSVAVTNVVLTFNHALSNAGTITAGQSRGDAAATGLSSGVDTISVDVPVFAQGILAAGATPGTATLVYGPEVAATATLRQNSIMRVHKVA